MGRHPHPRLQPHTPLDTHRTLVGETNSCVANIEAGGSRYCVKESVSSETEVTATAVPGL